MKKFNICTGIGVLMLAVFAYMQTLTMIAKIETDALGPAFWPKWLSIVLGFLGVLLILQGLIAKNKQDASIDFKSEGFKRVLKICALLVVFAGVIYFLGMYVGIVFLLPICMWLHGERNRKILLWMTIGTCVFVFIVFGLLLKVPLPMGVLLG